MKRGITVSGIGSASATPDLLRLDLGAEAVERTPQVALAEAGRALEAMRDVLRAGGVEPADLASGAMSLWPRYEEKGRLAGYTAELRLSARLRSLPEAGELISRAVVAGGSSARLHGISFEHSDPAGLRAAARQAAWRDAAAAAEHYAALAGRALGAVRSVTETPAGGPIQPVMLRGAMAAVAESVPVEPGVSEITVRVDVRYELADITTDRPG